jgi:hypothetical protein
LVEGEENEIDQDQPVTIQEVIDACNRSLARFAKLKNADYDDAIQCTVLFFYRRFACIERHQGKLAYRAGSRLYPLEGTRNAVLFRFWNELRTLLKQANTPQGDTTKIAQHSVQGHENADYDILVRDLYRYFQNDTNNGRIIPRKRIAVLLTTDPEISVASISRRLELPESTTRRILDEVRSDIANQLGGNVGGKKPKPPHYPDAYDRHIADVVRKLINIQEARLVDTWLLHSADRDVPPRSIETRLDREEGTIEAELARLSTVEEHITNQAGIMESIND